MQFFVNNPDKTTQPIREDLGVDGRTIGEMLKNRAERTPGASAYRSKRNGSWQDTTWKDVYLHSQQVAAGLIQAGVQLGDRVAILSTTREEWALAAFGIALAGAVLVPVYPSTPDQGCASLLTHSDSMVVFVENEKQLTKLLSQNGSLKNVKKMILFEDAALESQKNNEQITSLSLLKKTGHAMLAQTPDLLNNIALHYKSVAAIVYTSGTTGQPKGAMLLHEAFTVGTRYALGSTPARFDDLHFMFLPMAHSFALMLTMYCIRIGFTTAFAENMDRVADNLAEVKPTCVVAVPRIFEKIYQGFLHKAEDGGPIKKKLVHWALSVGNRASRVMQQGKKPTGWLLFCYWIATQLVYKKLRQRLGGRIRWFISGSAPLSKEIIEFFHAAGMMVIEGYGLTETNSVTSVNRIDCYKFGSVGYVHHPDLQIKLAADGEIFTKGVTHFVGYFKQPDATQEVIDEEGWFHTGDVGSMDPDGFVYITDRKKDLIKTSGGKFVAPQMLEGKIKMHPLVSQAVTVGDRRPYITALLSLNPEAVKKSLGSSTPLQSDEITNNPILVSVLEAHLAEINKTLGSWEQIKYFRILPKELTENEGELTPSLKIKRKLVTEKYKDLIQSMYEEHTPPEKWNL